MDLYILKSAACLIILITFYKLFLERENMHRFKRLYLLGSLMIAFVVPLITFTSYVEASEGISNSITSTVIASEGAASKNYLTIVLWSIYVLGLLFFSLKFFRNLSDILQKIKCNPKLKTRSIINVLLNVPTTPHTFFSYIFLNKRQFESGEIPTEILLHEQTHAKQKHSIDILIIELSQIVFWFNPLIYLFKDAIKLNHEFLADRGVLEKGISTSNYQNLLVAFSSNAHSPQLANSINYSSIKKRLTVMKTVTSKRSTLVRTLLILPLVTFLIFGFSSREVIQKEGAYDHVELYQEKATAKQVAEYNKLAKKYNSQDQENMFVKKKDVERLKYLYNLMNEKQRNNAEPFPKFPPMPASPKAPKELKAPKAAKATKAPKSPKEPKSVIVMGVNDKNPNIPPPPPKAPKAPKAPKTNSFVEKVSNEDNGVPPPPPIVSEKPLDHIIRMANQNAAFLYEGQRISSDKAIELLKKNNNLNIETQTFEKSNPIVKISKHGFKQEK